MAFNTPVASKTKFGVVEVGTNIDVTNGVIDLPQSVALTADVTFDTVTSTGAVTDTGNRVITTLTAGTNITITGVAPSLTINASSTPAYSVIGIDETDSPYTALASDYYIGVLATAAVTIDLPAGTDGDSYVIKSEAGNTGDITINPNGIELIEGLASFTIPYVTDGSITIIFRSNNWNIV
jgi:hypothetical protein